MSKRSPVRTCGTELPRVHFDVRQRPIVDWKDEDDRSFGRRLGNRFRAIIAPIVRADAQDAHARSEATKFARLPREQRQNRLLQAAIALARRSAFRPSASEVQPPRDQAWLGYKALGAIAQRLLIVPVENYTKGQLESLYWSWFDLLSKAVPQRLSLTRYRDHVIVASRTSVPATRVESVFRDFARMQERPWMMWRRVEGGRWRNLHVIAPIRSEHDFNTLVAAVMRSVR